MRASASADESGKPPANPLKVLCAVELRKEFAAPVAGRAPVLLFEGLSLEVRAGQSVAIMGQSGAGKTSLLHLLAGLERPTSGEIWIRGHAIHALSARELATVRNRQIGYLWQAHHLLPEFSAAENVAMPLRAQGVSATEALARANHGLGRVGLQSRAQHRPGELSGGEQARAALARALVTQPALLLADEPTGNLDAATAAHCLDLLHVLCHEEQLAVVLVTHSREAAGRCDQVLELAGGRLREAAL